VPPIEPRVRYLLAFLLSLGCLFTSVIPAWAGAPPSIPVMIVGGSAASGWNDPTGHGYVERGLNTFAAAEGLSFSITNYGIRGAPVVDRLVRMRYPLWLKRLGPHGVVVLAWGMLNDLRLGTPPQDVGTAIRHEIAQALANGDSVLVVAPPVTRWSVGKWQAREATLVRLEDGVAEGFDSPQVHVVNTYFVERRLWTEHHYNYRHFMDTRYDPNLHGYVLAGRIMARQLEDNWDPYAFLLSVGPVAMPRR
jgi:hypothetical protein